MKISARRHTANHPAPLSDCSNICEFTGEAPAIRTGQIKRFLVSPNASDEQINVLLTKVSPHDIQSFVEKLNELDGISAVSIIERKRGDQLWGASVIGDRMRDALASLIPSPLTSD